MGSRSYRDALFQITIAKGRKRLDPGAPSLYSSTRMKKTPENTVEGSAKLFKACADPVRLRLINLLSGREVCVCHLHEALELPQPTVSRHLAYLRRAGLVIGRKEGLWVYYSLAKPPSEFHRNLLKSVSVLGDQRSMLGDVARLARLGSC